VPFSVRFLCRCFFPMCVYARAFMWGHALCVLWRPFGAPPPPPRVPVSADGITDTSLGSLTMYARNKLASWQATGHPLVGPAYTEVQSLLE
jgi:hypothetical protein